MVKMARRNDPYMPFRQQNAHLTLSICGGRHIWSLKSHEHGLLSPRTASARCNCAATAPRAAGSQHPPWGTHHTETDELFCSKFLSEKEIQGDLKLKSIPTALLFRVLGLTKWDLVF